MGFQLPSCPSSSEAPSGREHTDSAHWWVCVKQGLGSFPGLQEGIWSCWIPSWFRDETQGVWSVLSWHLSTCSGAVYQDADIYLLDDPLSAVDAVVSRHLFEQWVCSCFLSSLLSRNPVEIGKGVQESFVLQETLPVLLWCPFLLQKIHHREILHHDEVRIGKYKRCFQCMEASGVCSLGSEG